MFSTGLDSLSTSSHTPPRHPARRRPSIASKDGLDDRNLVFGASASLSSSILTPRNEVRHRRRKHKMDSFEWVLWVAGLVVAWSGPVLAFGPASHIELGLEALRYLAILPAAVRTVIRHFPASFLYGTCAADIIVGKNMAKYVHHCHNWDVGFRMLEHAEGEQRLESLCWGFLSHLAADVVAHNYFVPMKMITGYRRPSARHLYWELRFDELAGRREDVSAALDQVGSTRFVQEDVFLREELSESSRLFPFEVSRKLFDSFMLLSRAERWKTMAANMAERSANTLSDEERGRVFVWSRDAVMALLVDGRSARVMNADPTGMGTLAQAKKLRRALRRKLRLGRVGQCLCESAQQLVDSSLRKGLAGKVELPSCEELADVCGD